MTEDMHDLIPVPEAARRAGVARNTMRLAATRKTIKAIRIGRDWFIYASDLDRWKRDNYRPDMAHRYPAKSDDDVDNT